MTEHNSYQVYTYGDNLKPGEELKICHTLSFREGKNSLMTYQHHSETDLMKLREDSVSAETAIFQKLCEAVSEWEKQAFDTRKSLCFFRKVKKWRFC